MKTITISNQDFTLLMDILRSNEETLKKGNNMSIDADNLWTAKNLRTKIEKQQI